MKLCMYLNELRVDSSKFLLLNTYFMLITAGFVELFAVLWIKNCEVKIFGAQPPVTPSLVIKYILVNQIDSEFRYRSSIDFAFTV